MVSKVAVGNYPSCGYVTGDDVELNLPLAPECSCGRDLNEVAVADQSEVQERR